jgi:hypothetical protein
MNLKRKSLLAVKRGARLFFQRRRARFGERIFGQNARLRLDSYDPFMSLSLSVRRIAICLCWGLFLGIPAAVFGQTNYYKTNGTEYAIIGSLPGDQVFPAVAVTTNGGFVVWQDNITDGDGWGISARRLDSTLSGTLSTFRVNVQGTNDQENPRVAMLKNNGAVFVWQGGKNSQEHIYARFLTPTNTFLTTTDLAVSTFPKNFQIHPAVTVLNNSNVVVVWDSFNQAGSNSFQDVYGQILSPSGQKVGTNFLINQFTNYNQRKPAVAALQNGRFVVAWVSEQERTVVSSIDNSFYAIGGAAYVSTNEIAIGASQNTNYFVTSSSAPTPSVDIYARLYSSNGVALGNEFLVNSNSNPCANPAVAAASDGAFMVAWSVLDEANLAASGWDVCARPFSSAGVGGVVSRVNTTVSGDQYIPQIRAIGLDYLIVWTSVGQDGSLEGVYGQFVHEDGTPVNSEFRVNTTTLARQMQPAVASDGAERFLVVWTGYNVASYNFDLFAQRYIDVNADLSAMDAPFVYAPFVIVSNKYQPQLVVSWPSLLGISVSNYEVYVDGAVTNMGATTSNVWTMTAANGLTTNSTHWFTVDYTTMNGRRSPLSAATTNSTWKGLNWGGIPYEWMAEFFGGYYNGTYHTNYWPLANSLVAPGGPTLLQVFLSGGDPYDSTTWLQTALTKTSQGLLFLSWNTQPGFTYQVQVTTNFISWNNLGSPRFAAGSGDSIFVGGGSAGYYRVLLLRQ